MPRPNSIFACSACGHQSPRWEGRCPGCGEWNTLVEEARPRSAAERGRASRGGSGAGRTPVVLADVKATEHARLGTGIGELDTVLGGGLVPGSLVLIGGAPGIGKSTLTTMALANLLGSGSRTLYVSAEESAAQVRMRAERLNGESALRIPVIAETDLHAVLATLEHERPEVCVIDSVQALHSTELTSAAGSVAQVREVAGEVMRVAKSLEIAVLLVGHVTKEGNLAGPRVLEHLVDCVLQFEGERERTYRTVRAVKNRFGSTNEAGRVRDARRRAGRGARRLGAIRRRGDARARKRRPVRDGGLAAVAGRGAGAGVAVRARSAATSGRWARPQSARARARGARAPRRDRARRRRRVRQRRRRRAGRRAGRRPRGRAGGGQRGEERGARRWRTDRLRASGSSASPASCGPSPTRSAASPRRGSSALRSVVEPGAHATLRCALQCALGAGHTRKLAA